MTRFLKYLVLLIAFPAFTHAQQSGNFQRLKFEHFGTDQGFPQSFFCMVQDKTGFIWIGTEGGLYRYDGYQFKIFIHDPNDKTSLKNQYVNSLFVADDSIIWIGTQGGLYSYNPRTESLLLFKSKSKEGVILSNTEIDAITEDESGNLYVCTGSEGFISYNLISGKTLLFNQAIDNPIHFQENSKKEVFIDHSKNIWVGGDGLYRIDHLTKKISVYRHMVGDKFSISHNVINGIMQDSRGIIWIGTENGLNRFDTSTKKFTVYWHQKGNDSSLSSDWVNQVIEDHNGVIWACTYVGGLERFNRQSESFTAYESSVNDPLSLSTNYIAGMMEDRSGALWLAIEGGGMNKCSLLKENFSVYKNFVPKPRAQYACALYRDENGMIWMATNGAGFFSFNPATKKFTAHHFNETDPLLRTLNFPCGFCEDDHHQFWIAFIMQGLIRFDRSSGDYVICHSDERVGSVAEEWSIIQGMCSDSLGRIWLATNVGLKVYDPAIKEYKSYAELFPDSNKLSSDNIITIFKDDNARPETIGEMFWLGGFMNGLIQVQPNSGKTKYFRHDENNVASIPSNLMYRITSDKNGLLWITTDGGLCVFDRKKEIFRMFTMRDGLPSNSLGGLLIDDCNNIWISTTGGICKCSYNQNESPFTAKMFFRKYDIGDGTGCNDFLGFEAGCARASDGTMYFSSLNGLVAFNPDSMKDNPYVPPVVLTDFSLFNKSVSPNDSSSFLKNSITFSKEIKLSYKQNVIGFTFAALSYVHPEKNQYAYKLDNFDKDWIYTDASKRFANYTNLDAGDYTFKVKASNNDGVWNQTPTTIHLIITPPYWETWWFRILVVGFVAGIVYGIYRYRLQQILKLQTIRNNIASDLHDDIGSTLNSISIFSQVAKQQSEKNIPALDQIGTSARTIVESMSDIVWTINPENDSFEKVIVRMRSFAYQVLKAKKIEFSFRVDPDLNSLTLPMQVRKNFYLIFKEAVNNIVKYSNATRASFQITHTNRQIKLEVRDDGIGFDPAKTSNGNGIKNMRRRAKEIAAELLIESKSGEGTRIELAVKTK